MLRAAWEKSVKWWTETGRPKLFAVTDEWWTSIDENPRPHFISMVFGMLVLSAVKFLVWLAA